MGLSSWLHAKIEEQSGLIKLLGIISMFCTILGVNMQSLPATFPQWILNHFVSFALIINTIITLYVIRWGLIQKNKRKTFEVLCGRLYGQVRKDHSRIMNMIWETNKDQNKLMFRDELDQLIYDAECILEDRKKRKS
jgi:hypothetical protein